MDRVKSQTAVVSQLLFDPKTAGAYKDVLTLTGKIIKEVALLVWLLICSVLVLGAWFSDLAISTGRRARQWWQAQQMESTDGNQAAAATGQAFLDVSQNGANFLIDRAREQLGLDKVERPIAKANSKEVPKPQAVAQKVSTPAPAAAERVTPVTELKTTVEKDTSEQKASS
ncbi:MAG: hypothetical protein AAGF93_05780 [Cyanobacteria bacterium P01_H01_bin.105]